MISSDASAISMNDTIAVFRGVSLSVRAPKTGRPKAVEDSKDTNEHGGKPRLNTDIDTNWFCNTNRHEPGQTADEVTCPECIKCGGF